MAFDVPRIYHKNHTARVVTTPADHDTLVMDGWKPGEVWDADRRDERPPTNQAVNTVVASGSAVTLPEVDVTEVSDVTLSANATITVPSPAANRRLHVLVRQGATPRTLAWAGSITWAGGTVPTQAATAGSASEYAFTSFNGTVWRGRLLGSYTA